MDKINNIVILTAAHPYKASGIIAYDLMLALKKHNKNVLIITNGYLEKNYENTISLKNLLRKIFDRLSKYVKFFFRRDVKTDQNYYMYGLKQSSNKTISNRILKSIPFHVDAFIYLFPQYFLTIKDLQYLNEITKAPILWFLMDMAPLTGGCHYSNGCDRYKSTCGKCPGIYSNAENDVTYKNLSLKRDIINNSNIIPIAASEWQFKQLTESNIFSNKKKYLIHTIINEEIFKQGNKFEARSLLRLPLSKKIFFFGAVSPNEKRKGLKELISALDILSNTISSTEKENIHIIIAGKSESVSTFSIPFEYSYLSNLNYSDLALTYQAADAFICPSIEDAGPMMINQSIMCGTPVISFEMGVALDLVFTGQTGYRAKLGDIKDLALGLKYILDLDNNQTQRIKENCIAISLEKCQSYNNAFKFIEVANQNIQQNYR